jgi:hypothetical protein
VLALRTCNRRESCAQREAHEQRIAEKQAGIQKFASTELGVVAERAQAFEGKSASGIRCDVVVRGVTVERNRGDIGTCRTRCEAEAKISRRV